MSDHIYHLADIHLLRPSVLTIGVFDGVHRGHQYLIRQLVQRAHAADKLAVVLTFFPHPDVVLRDLSGRYYLTTPEQRAAALFELGVDTVVTHPFNESTRQMPADAFVDLLVKHMRIDELWVGQDFALGYEREGDVTYLSAQGRARGFSVHAIELLPRDDDHAAISSTAIRQALRVGDVATAADLLGRPYSVSGEVVHGQKRGRSIGFPTANIAAWPQQMLPANGVYAGWLHLDGQDYMAVTNIGVRPTFDGADVTVEAHILDFDRSIYERNVSFHFTHRLRGEQKFSGIEALMGQISADVQAARTVLSPLKP